MQTLSDHLAREDVQKALKLRLRIVAKPNETNILGYTGVGYGIVSDDVVVVDNQGNEIVYLIAMVNLN